MLLTFLISLIFSLFYPVLKWVHLNNLLPKEDFIFNLIKEEKASKILLSMPPLQISTWDIYIKLEKIHVAGLRCLYMLGTGSYL